MSKQQDRKTLGKISDLGERVVKASLAIQKPVVGVPLRTMSNTIAWRSSSPWSPA